ncbi:hypothetical protein [Secundilactobacillus folii]|uniref:Uncharacterized protein n=1 Tax=Secundilactobacillus folii TaxID=2678357 RepID=A0A7X3C2C5_9LACO|nr:hypothetical protein [Secundilactobacillus folii]MTV81332.1 hypothetical protein [Secundilactobacillus folii]
MRLKEVVTLVQQLSPSLKLGLDSSPIKPISGMSKSDGRLLFHTATKTPLTIEAFRQHATHFDDQLVVFSSSGKRLFGFRQENHWLLFK